MWSFTALITSRLDPDRPEIQFLVIASMLGAMDVRRRSRGFNEHAVVFAGAYVAVQLGRSVFLAVVHRPERIVSLRVIFWLGTSGMLWLLGGVTASHGVRGVLWTLTVGLDFAGAAFGWPTPRLGRARVAEWSIAGEHLAERYFARGRSERKRGSGQPGARRQNSLPSGSARTVHGTSS
ncbi:low temperature requirement protein A [Micromonospora sp. NBC_01796]|uniref:low temperature requirement protein A n=1 Tax=Micromonospora sp. NBC_01796 TaxID=2975987 RepID=UPI002DDACD10|nr:low temperature requirement protein A [Micromonospora sp. NBC_01796]WSA84038.1 low temperature requirement protein A [Micromonospora sp. NBC_01796]